MESWKPHVIVLAYDGSTESRKAADITAAIALRNKAKVVVATAYRPYPRVAEPSEKDVLEQENAREIGSKLVEEFKALGITARADDLEGPAQQAILKCADAYKADMIVTGSRGLGGLTGMLLGSVSEYVVRRASVPVLVAR